MRTVVIVFYALGFDSLELGDLVAFDLYEIALEYPLAVFASGVEALGLADMDKARTIPRIMFITTKSTAWTGRPGISFGKRHPTAENPRWPATSKPATPTAHLLRMANTSWFFSARRACIVMTWMVNSFGPEIWVIWMPERSTARKSSGVSRAPRPSTRIKPSSCAMSTTSPLSQHWTWKQVSPSLF